MTAQSPPLATSGQDQQLQEVAAELLRLDPHGERMAAVFRSTFDQVYDGQRTGRYRLDQLYKTEKIYFWTLVEINLQREFGLADGRVLDYSIAGHEVDCSYSHAGDWMLPFESFDQIVLVTEADDERAIWSAGLVRATEASRQNSENRDGTARLNDTGRAEIYWLHREKPMQPNALLELDPIVVESIMSKRNGQLRVNELFRRATNVRISRTVVATVAQQSDYLKRVRGNGGAPSTLCGEGFLILDGDSHSHTSMAEALGAEVPLQGELVSVQVVPTDEGNGVPIGEGWWRQARPGEAIAAPAPVLATGRV